MAKKKKKKKVSKKDYQIEVGGPYTRGKLLERIKILSDGIEAGAFKGRDLYVAKKRRYHYQYQLDLLTGDRVFVDEVS